MLRSALHVVVVLVDTNGVGWWLVGGCVGGTFVGNIIIPQCALMHRYRNRNPGVCEFYTVAAQGCLVFCDACMDACPDVCMPTNTACR